MFCRYALRTTDVDAARAFYAEAVGLALPAHGSAEGSSLELWPLHEQARARGAPAHWLGLVAVADVEALAARLVALGGERLGPTVEARDGTPFATLRDPWGAVVGVRARGEHPSDRPIRWHQLHTRDVDAAWTAYAELFGWALVQTIDVPDPVGGHRLFAWKEGGEPVGSMANTARWPGIHPHWLFHLPVDDLDARVARVRALGGTAKDPIALPDGSRLAACEDPQGAAFGLFAGTKATAARG
jgi:predicted enzyme related to lactoylglutathione lyase